MPHAILSWQVQLRSDASWTRDLYKGYEALIATLEDLDIQQLGWIARERGTIGSTLTSR